MMPLKDIKIKSGKRKRQKSFQIVAADPEKSYFKRNVSAIIDDLTKKLKNEKPITDHVYSVLCKSEVGRKSSVGQHLIYKFKLNQLGDHHYLSRDHFDKNILNTDPRKKEKIYPLYKPSSTRFLSRTIKFCYFT